MGVSGKTIGLNKLTATHPKVILEQEENGGVLYAIRLLCVLFVILILGIQLWSLYTYFGKSYLGIIEDTAFNHVIGDKSWSFATSNSQKWLLQQKCSLPPITQRFNCFPEITANEESCLKRGCCWNPVNQYRYKSAQAQVHQIPKINRTRSIGIPYCYYPLHSFPGYSIISHNSTSYGETANISRTTSSYYPNDIKNAQIQVFYETDNIIRIKIFDTSSDRYEVPIIRKQTQHAANNRSYTFSLVTNDDGKFYLTVARSSSGTSLFNTSVGEFIFADQFLQISSLLASQQVYGLGEHRDSLIHSTNWTRYVFWAKDQFPTPDADLYGVYPFYMAMESTGHSHGVLFLNSNAQEVILQPTPAITFRSIGGIFDFYIFMGPDPNSVIKQLTSVVGLPALPPYWSLGFHLCRWGYKNDTELMEVINRMRDAGFPYDTQWNDIDYMVSYLDFTYDKRRYSKLPDIIQDLHDHGQHYVMITDPGISNKQPAGSYPPYDEGLNMDIFIRHQNGSLMVGKVWPGETVFPDFTHPMATEYWSTQIARLHNQFGFDGMWIDMNEPSSQYSGSSIGCTDLALDHPPYTPYVTNGLLYDRTLCPSGKQYLSTHYDLHNMYGYFEMKVTNEALVSVRGTRPLIISRSTFAGSGKYGGHWLGDNLSSWKDLYYSIPGILHFQMYGLPLVGVDICGFRGNTNEELCTRWTQLGSFYPFARNHNSLGQNAQDPAVFSPSAQQAMKKALLTRYLLLPYLYTLFHYSNINGDTVARPLFFEFPLDKVTYSIDRQFMWGSALLISPVLEQGATSVEAYIPSGVWYDFYTGETVYDTGMYLELDAPLDKINLHVRGGHILPLQQPAYSRHPGPITTTTSRNSPFKLIVALNKNKFANGSLFWDDGEMIDSYERKLYTELSFLCTLNVVTSLPLHVGFPNATMMLNSVNVYGVDTTPSQVEVNGKSLDKHFYSYSIARQVLNISSVDVSLLKPVTIKWN